MAAFICDLTEQRMGQSSLSWYASNGCHGCHGWVGWVTGRVVYGPQDSVGKGGGRSNMVTKKSSDS